LKSSILKPLNIGKINIPLPILQGGMAIRVSTAPLAGAVAREGAGGIIAATGMGDEELSSQIRLAKKISEGNGAVGINVMYAYSEFERVVKTAIAEGIDFVATGAGFSRDIYKWVKDSNTPILPIVSSAKLARIAEKLGASAIILEGTEAGGHLGTDRSTWDIIPEILQVISIPLIVAGGIYSGKEMARALKMGANGVQVATRFALSEECDVSPVFKKVLLEAKAEDVVKIMSSVGFPGRAILTPLSRKIIEGKAPRPEVCKGCIKNCSRTFCIRLALESARLGDYENGLFFSGSNVFRYSDILPVKTIIENFVHEAEEELS
jgi:NAD(P)H-dependent flavin oxidoreductase YrpB (nitropropane dioxygenase family)